MKIIFQLGYLLLMSGFLWGCKKSEVSGVPYVPIYFQSNISSDPRLFMLNQPTGVATVDGFGVRGLFIVRDADGGLRAYDRCSTVEPQKLCRLKIENSYLAVDTCSGGKFSLLGGGQPAEAPAKIALRQYSVTEFNGSIIVRN